jgi:DNA-binding Lrp family transcriptional regulator
MKLKEKGILKPMRITTHERKLGLGENLILLNTNQNKEKDLLRLFELIPYIYNYSSTYGKFNGYLARFIFSLKDPNINLDLLKAMEEKDIISDFYIFEIIDYKIKNKFLSFYDPNKGWTWDWDEWYDTIKNSIKIKSKKFEFKTKEDSKLEDFDYKDILLLKNMFENASITLKELKNILNLSETQIGKRIQRLEEKEIIKAYYYDYSLIRSKELIYFYCFFEVGKYVNSVLSCLYQLPYDFAILIESSHKFCISLKLDANDFKKFLA